MADEDAAERERAPRWWQTLPGGLTAIAGLITAVTGLVVAVKMNDNDVVAGESSAEGAVTFAFAEAAHELVLRFHHADDEVRLPVDVRRQA